MMLLRKILFPLAILYWIVTWVRNILFDTGIAKSVSWPVPVIAVGNLSVGGTGKTPQVEYLLRLLAGRYRTAVLSRGYKRTTKGYVLAQEGADASSVGDEPFQYYCNFPDVSIAVNADRNHGIKMLLNSEESPEVIVLDDAYQHRKVKAGLYILLTMYGDLYIDDYVLPFGNLRESIIGADRAHLIVVSKCPPDLSESTRQQIRHKLKLNNSQSLFFTSIRYDENAVSDDGSKPLNTIGRKLIVSGIANPQPFIDHVEAEGDYIMTYPDHHPYTDEDVQQIISRAAGCAIITTQKDFVRLVGKVPVKQLYFIPIRTEFVADGISFDEKVLEYVASSLQA